MMQNMIIALAIASGLGSSSVTSFVWGESMPGRNYKVTKPSKVKSELEQFAGWFHQDWKVVFKDFHQGARMYFQSLSVERKAKLQAELAVFIATHNNASLQEIKKSWLQLGAEGWQSTLDIRETLNRFAQMLED